MADTQFLIGDSIMAAPVVQQGAVTSAIYFPPGLWYALPQPPPATVSKAAPSGGGDDDDHDRAPGSGPGRSSYTAVATAAQPPLPGTTPEVVPCVFTDSPRATTVEAAAFAQRRTFEACTSGVNVTIDSGLQQLPVTYKQLGAVLFVVPLSWYPSELPGLSCYCVQVFVRGGAIVPRYTPARSVEASRAQPMQLLVALVWNIGAGPVGQGGSTSGTLLAGGSL